MDDIVAGNALPARVTPRVFRVGVSPDFYEDAKGSFEHVLQEKLGDVPGLEFAPLPPQPGKIAQPDALNQFDALFTLSLRITPESLKGVHRLAVVARWGVGYDMIDVPALTQSDVALAITPGAVRRPVAEAIVTFIFALSTNLRIQDRIVRSGAWRGDLPKLGRNIKGRTLGSIGCGNIAQEMFGMVRSIGFGRMIAADPSVSPAKMRELGVEPVSLDDVLRESDFVCVNTFLNEDTRGLIGERELRLMKPDAFLINTARGPIVQEAALIRALQENWIAGAGLDVFETEPLPKGNPLREMENVILSPHGLAWTAELARDNSVEACSNILAIARGEVPASVVNKDVVGRPGFQEKLVRFRGQS